MTPQELKNSILQLAIQGKLVEQRAEEGTAEELYQQIQEEKQRLIAEKKIKKEKSLPEITDDEKPFDIPDSWKWVRLNSISWFFDAGKSPKCDKQPVCKNEWGVITTTAIQNRYFDETKNKILPQNFTINTDMQIHMGDVLITRAGPINRTGIACLVKNIKHNLILSDKTLRINMSDKILYKDYIVLALNSPPIRTLIIDLMSGMDKQQVNISQDKYKTLPIPLPPLAEQKRIVEKIEQILPYIDRYENARGKLETFNKRFPDDMKKSLLQYAIEGKLVEQRPEEGKAEELYHQIQEEKQRLIAEKKIKKEKPLPEITEDEIPFDIPDSWKWVRLQEITILNPKNNLDDEIDVSFIPMTLIDDGFSNNYTFEVRKWGEIKKGFTHFANGDIGVAKITPCFQNRKSVIFSELYNSYGAGTTELSIIRVINNLISRRFLLWFFKSAYFIENGVKSFTGTAGQQRIHKDYLSTCLLPLPPLAEQKRIVEKLEQMLPLCERLK